VGQSDLSPTTRLGAALAADPDLFERLVAGDAVFARLRTVVGTPTADKLTLDDAACVAGRDVAMLLAIARGEQAPASKGSQDRQVSGPITILFPIGPQMFNPHSSRGLPRSPQGRSSRATAIITKTNARAN